MVMSLSPPFHSRLELNQAYGVPEGLVLAGFVRNLPDRSPGSVTVTASPLQWTVSGTCRGGFGIVNQAQIEVSGTGDGALCKAYVLSDPLNEFTLSTKGGTVTVAPRFQPQYASAPYACRVRVVTTGGVRTITFPPPAAITDAERQHLEAFRHNFESVCQKWKDTFHTIELVGWGVPGPVEQPFIQFWQVVVHGLQREDTIRVVGLDGATVMTAKPSRAGVAHMSVMFPGDQAPSELSLELSGGRREENEVPREISVQQVLFEHRATLPVRGPLGAMRFEGTARNPRLVIVDAEQDMIWDVTVPLAPALLRSATLAEDGNRDRLVVQSGKRVGAAPTPNLLRVLERLQDRLGPVEAVGSPRVGGIAETLYVRTGRGATLFDIANAEEPREMQVYESPAWYEGVALGGKLMARYNPDLNVVEIYYGTVTKTL